MAGSTNGKWDDEIEKAANDIHDLCLRCDDGEVPGVKEIIDILEELVSGVASDIL